MKPASRPTTRRSTQAEVDEAGPVQRVPAADRHQDQHEGRARGRPGGYATSSWRPSSGGPRRGAGPGEPGRHEREHGQEEVYTALSGSATLHVGDREYRLEPGVFARIGAGERRRVTTADEPVQLLAIGGTPGAAYEAPPFTALGAPLPG